MAATEAGRGPVAVEGMKKSAQDLVGQDQSGLEGTTRRTAARGHWIEAEAAVAHRVVAATVGTAVAAVARAPSDQTLLDEREVQKTL